jgi:hypothetical protein
MNETENETLEEERVIQSTTAKRKRENPKTNERMKHPKKELLQLNSERN